jgi:predicted enzyme related to lactoylglutathione lyase
MSGPQSAFAFTKLVVHDLEKMAAFYCAAYGLAQVGRVRERIGDEPIDEIMLGAGAVAPGALILLRFPERAPAPPGSEVLLGFTTDDLPALLDRVCAAGGAVHAPIRRIPEMNLHVAFARDPEGHVAELVQLLA